MYGEMDSIFVKCPDDVDYLSFRSTICGSHGISRNLK